MRVKPWGVPLEPPASVQAHGKRYASRTGQQAPGLVGSDLELPALHRAALDLDTGLVLARRKIHFRAVRLASGPGLAHQVAAGISRELHGLFVDGDDSFFMRGVAEQQPRLPRRRE